MREPETDESSEGVDPRAPVHHHHYSQHKNGNGNKLAWIVIPINVGVLVAVIAWVIQSNIALQIIVARLDGRVDTLIETVNAMRGVP